jgi:inner membrane protein
MEKIGKFFKEFTPFMYIKYVKTTEGVRANFFDLRYFIKNRFLHNGTLVLNNEM